MPRTSLEARCRDQATVPFKSIANQFGSREVGIPLWGRLVCMGCGRPRSLIGLQLRYW